MKTETATAPASHRVAIKNIAVMTDFSEASATALDYAAAWARRLGAKLHVVHFVRPAAYVLAGDAYAELMDKIWQDGRAGLAAIDASPRLEDIPHATRLDPGEVPGGLCELVRTLHLDLVVLASAAHTGLEKVVLGSTAELVFRTLPVPVLMLGPRARNVNPVRGIQSLLFATDFGPASERAAVFAFSLAQEQQARLHLLHVVPLPGVGKASQQAAVDVAEQQLRALIPAGAESWCDPAPLVRVGDAAVEIVKAADELHSDLIVLGTRRPPRLSLYTGWANAYKVLHDAPCPVLTVRE